MTTPDHRVDAAGRRGMTLVELLVVTGLLGVLLGLVVTGVRGGGRSQKRAADTLAAVLASAQARALGVPEGAAVILAAGSGSEANAAAACTSVFDAVMLPLVEATVTGTGSGLPPTPLSSVTTTVNVSPTNGEDPQRAYKILLSASDPTAPPTAWLSFSGSTAGTIGFRTPGQTTGNTVWPKPPVSGTFTAVLAQYPAKSSAVADLEDGSAIDLRFSGIGDERSVPYGRLDLMVTSTTSIAVVFDRVGRVAEVIQQVPDPGMPAIPGAAQPAIPVGTIYFLVAPRDLIVSGSNTLASEQATWVALVPQTGRILVAENVPQADTTTSALRAARAKARQGIGVGK